MYALSLKQPWAALVLHGLKSIEIRKWATTLRGPILLHAAKVDDARPEGWAMLTADAKPAAELRGGIIGQLEVIDCLTYRTLGDFRKDEHKHRNLPAWFTPPKMHGFEFRAPVPVSFLPWPGNVRFFTVPLDDLLAGKQPPEKKRGRAN